MTMIISGSDGLEFPDGSDQGTAFTGNAATITSGTIDTARLATGTANSSTYLRGDQTWAAVPAATPGGSTTQVQYNNAGAFGGDADFTFNGTTVTMANDASISGLTVGKGAGAVSGNTAVGESALLANTTGTYNTATGSQALYSTTAGNYNTANGRRALFSNTTGANNTAVGRDSLLSSTTASNNVAVGYQALYNNTDLGNNVAVGFQAGYTYNGDYGYNTLIGFRAGFLLSGSSSGYGNTFVGANSNTGQGAGYSVTTGSNNVILGGYTGNQGGLNITTASNRIVLSDGDGNPRIYADNNGQFYSLITGVGLYADYGCRVWVNMNGTGTPSIRGSGSVSSITDNGTCSYTLNFSITLPDTNYSVNVSQNIESSGSTSQMMGVMTSSNSSYTNKSTTAVRIQGYNPVSSNFDPFEVDVAIFR
jgi:hypothetical protein